MRCNFAFEVRQYYSNRLSSACAGRHDVHGSSAGTAQIFVGSILQVLIGSVGVNGIHEELLHTKGLVQYHNHGHQAIGGTAGVGDYQIAVLNLVCISANYESRNIICFRRCRKYYALCAGLQVEPRFFFIQKDTRAFQHNINLHSGPRQLGRVFHSKGSNFVAIYSDAGIVRGYTPVETAVHGIILKQVGKRLIIS